MDASLSDLDLPLELIQEKTEESSVSVAPSHQHKALDTSNTYKVRSAVGEVTTGTSRDSTNQYSAEVSITYQRL